MINVGDDADATVFGELGGGFDFREHGASFEIAVFCKAFGFFGGEVSELFLSGQTVIDIDIRDGSDGDENVGFH